MPPCIANRITQSISRQSTSIAAFLVPFVQIQSRSASILSSLSDLPGAYSKRIRRGRGPSSGKGKTSGRGHKGQKQHGKVPVGFTGGQTPEHITHGKMGFKNIHSLEYAPVNLDRIQDWITQGRLDASRPITLKELAKTRAIHGVQDGVKLLARGSTALTTPINIVVSRASQSAIAAVEALGGTVITRFYTRQSIRRIRQGMTDPYISLKWDPELIGIPALKRPDQQGATAEDRALGLGYEYRLPDPSSRKEIEYYRDAKNRGYLAHTVKAGEAASLYFKPPLPASEIAKLKRKSGKDTSEAKKREENKLW